MAMKPVVNLIISWRRHTLEISTSNFTIISLKKDKFYSTAGIQAKIQNPEKQSRVFSWAVEKRFRPGDPSIGRDRMK